MIQSVIEFSIIKPAAHDETRHGIGLPQQIVRNKMWCARTPVY